MTDAPEGFLNILFYLSFQGYPIHPAYHVHNYYFLSFHPHISIEFHKTMSYNHFKKMIKEAYHGTLQPFDDQSHKQS